MPEYKEKRMFPRYVCDGGVHVRADANRGSWGTLSDISAGGCYIQSFQPMAKGTALIFDMKVKGFDIHGEGKVVAQHPGVGMAVHFVHFAPEDEKKLNELLKLLQSQEAQQGGVIVTP